MFTIIFKNIRPLRSLAPVFLFTCLVNPLHSQQIGSELRVTKIILSDQIQTQPQVILRELKFIPGQTIDSNQIEKLIKTSIQNLRNLGFFEDIEVTPQITETSNLTLTVFLKERWTLFPIPSFGWDNNKGPTFTLFLIDYNFFHSGLGIQSTLEYNQYKKRIDFSLNDKHVLNSPVYSQFVIGWTDYIDTIYTNSIPVFITSVDRLKISLKTGLPLFNQTAGTYLLSVFNLKNNSVQMDLIARNLPAIEWDWKEEAGFSLGSLNRNGALIWGTQGEIAFGIAPQLLYDYYISLSFKTFSVIFEKSLLGLYLTGIYNSTNEFTKTIRGVSQGEVRGNYGATGNLELRLHTADFQWPIRWTIYNLWFVDSSLALYHNRPLDADGYQIVAGTGFYLYAKYYGGLGATLRLDTGINITKLSRGNPLDKAFYIGLNFTESF